ncbi:uncharacterized protein [Leptinotarsa decemlineata]|uniref:uncharacterized protein n=1 Tax=Leptinotarsa decemlineata TaxID=7539 RepID=UPI003D30B13C
MGQIPRKRLTREIRPFVNVGMDYFGPFHVKIGRRKEKRWGVIFTCLSIRATHQEISHTLNSESAIMAILRMVARRGQPKIIFRDNGTNFVAAVKKLNTALQNINNSSVVDAMSYVPPICRAPGGALHIGGT